jgi:hypothetical protein
VTSPRLYLDKEFLWFWIWVPEFQSVTSNM